jgi:uncharacterized membrane protein YkvA (DUF1232 family)
MSNPRGYTGIVDAWQLLAVSLAAALVLVAGLSVAGWLALRLARRHPLVRRILALPTRGKLALVRRLVTSRDVPLPAKLALPALLLYLALPFDLVPDFVPVLGYADDALAVAGAIALVLWLTPAQVIEGAIEAEESRFGSRDWP